MKKLFINLLFLLMIAYFGQAQNLDIKLAFNDSVSKKPVTGRVFVFFNKNTIEPLGSPRFHKAIPSFAMDVKDWKPDEFITITNENATSWMGNLDSLAGWYAVQAFLKTNTQDRYIIATGNGFSNKNIIYIDSENSQNTIHLLFNSIGVYKEEFHETDFLKEIKIESKIISSFNGTQEQITAAVVLPNSYYQDTTKFYPCVYVLPAWGSTHYDLDGDDFFYKRYGMGNFCLGEEKIFIYLDHECSKGYHEFCNSENNGNREQTFFEEVIPYIEQNFRVNKTANTRFLMGHSSGAWAALWLIINNPDKFAGAFVSSPDPVDFTSFLGKNIYKENTNMFYTSSGEIKVFFASETMNINVTMKDYVGYDNLIGCGEQIYSFDATFSKKGKDGKPEKLFDWETGLINPDAAKNWENYDLSKVVSKLDKKKKNQLSNKINIYTSEDDEFGLNIPVKYFKQTLEESGIKAEIIFFEKGGHSGLWTDELRKNIHNQMDVLIKKK